MSFACVKNEYSGPLSAHGPLPWYLHWPGGGARALSMIIGSAIIDEVRGYRYSTRVGGTEVRYLGRYRTLCLARFAPEAQP